MRINSESDYFQFLAALIEVKEQLYVVISESIEDQSANLHLPTLPDGTSLDEAEAKLLSAIRGYLRGLTSQKARELGKRAPSLEIREVHEYQRKKVEEQYLARVVGQYFPGRSTTQELAGKAALRLMLHEKQRAEHKARVKEKGRVVICAACQKVLHSSDSRRVKLLGHTRYCRLCNVCADKADQEKAIANALKRK